MHHRAEGRAATSSVVRIAVAAMACVLTAHAHAVDAQPVSITARATCELRAIAALAPDPRLRNPDTWATKLCTPLRLPRDYDAARSVIDDDHDAYAGYFYVNARTHHIDALLSQALRAGARQVVILGAGLDTRAYRFGPSHPRVRFFEVDLPAMIEHKRRVMRSVPGKPVASLRYVPLDLDRATLAEALADAGYRRGERSFFIAEGVTMYVGARANEDILALAGHAARGSELVFDYLVADMLDPHVVHSAAAEHERKGLAALGEPLVTGWPPPRMAALLDAHGLALASDLDASSLAQRYLVASDGHVDGMPPPWYRIVHARVRPQRAADRAHAAATSAAAR